MAIDPMANPRLFVMDGRNTVPVFNSVAWSKWMADHEEDRVISRTRVNADCFVSTVFLGIDHGPSSAGKPVLFESKIFGGFRDTETHRYETYQKAVNGHARIVKSMNPDAVILTNLPPRLPKSERAE